MAQIGHRRTYNVRLRRLPSVRSNITVIFIENPNSLSSDYEKEIEQLHSLNKCSLIRYKSLSNCIKYLKQARSYEYIILVISKDVILEKVFIALDRMYELHRCNQVKLMFINTSIPQNKIQKRNAIPAYYISDHYSLFTKLQHLVDEIGNEDDKLFVTFNPKEKQLQDVRVELGPFLWNHSYRVMLKAMPYFSLEAKRQMLNECRAYYRGKPSELMAIDEFSRTYSPENVIYWYTKPSFLYHLINRALRTEDVLAQYKFRYFVVDMCTRLEEMTETTKTVYSTPFWAYRGAKLTRDELKNLKVGINDPTGNTPSRSLDDQQQYALLQIYVDWSTCPNLIVADVSAESAISDENEMIFDLGTTFSVTDVTFDHEHRLWHIRLIPSSEVAQLTHDYTAYIRKRMTEIKPRLLFGAVLADMSSDYVGALTYFHRLLRTEPFDENYDDDRPNIYYHIGRVYRYLSKYEEAIGYYQCARLLQRRTIPQTNLEYARTLTALGVAYSERGDSAKAINLHTRALSIFYTILPEDHIEIGHVQHKLAFDCLQQKQYERAFFLVSKSESFFKRKMPANHPGHAQALHTMGLIEHALGHNERAIDCLKQALRIRELLLANDAPEVAQECHELSLIYAEIDDGHIEALQYAERAYNICQQRLHPNHITHRKIVQNFERLRQLLDN